MDHSSAIKIAVAAKPSALSTVSTTGAVLYNGDDVLFRAHPVNG